MKILRPAKSTSTLHSSLFTQKKRRRDSNKERGDVIRLAFRTLCLCSAFCRNACASSSQYQTEKSTLGRDYIIHQNSTFVNTHFARYFTENFVILNSMKKFRGQCHSDFCAFCCDLALFYVQYAKTLCFPEVFDFCLVFKKITKK